MSQSRKFPELPPVPQNKHVAATATWFFGKTTGASPAVSAFYASHPKLLAKSAGPVNSWKLGAKESAYVNAHAHPASTTDQMAKRVPTIVRAASASAVGTLLSTAHRQLQEAHPDSDPTAFGGS